jgi:hypothetical protein
VNTRLLITPLVLGIVIAACGGDDSGGSEETAPAASSTTAVATTTSEATTTTAAASAGAFTIDLDGSRIGPELVAGYGELNVARVAAGEFDVWVSVGDAANDGEAFIARYDLSGTEIARIPDDGRPIGLVVDPSGLGVWFGDNFHSTLEFVEAATNEVTWSIADGVTLGSSLIETRGAVWSLGYPGLLQVDAATGEVVEQFDVDFRSSPSDLLLVGETLWGSDITGDTVTGLDLNGGPAQTFSLPGADAMVLLDDGTILVAGEELASIDPDTGEMTTIGAVIYPDKNQGFPARFTTLELTSSGLFGFDAFHGRLVHLDLEAMTAAVVDEVPIGFVSVGDIAESGDGALWLVVTGEESETSTEDHLRRYVIG